MELWQNDWTFLGGVGLLGLLVGSFLNVLIIRLPQIMRAEAQGQAASSLQKLCFPASHCPHCKKKIPCYYNIPLWSYCQLRGRCHECHRPISLQYPLVEAGTALLSLCVAMRYGWSIQTGAGLILVWGLVSLSVIDWHHQILPDTLTLPFMWLGLLLNAHQTFINPAAAITGAAIGYLSLWSLYWVFKWITGKEGMGYGDFKLMALMGAWFGWEALLFILFLSSV